MVRSLLLNRSTIYMKRQMRNKYIAPSIHIIVLDSELNFMSGSSATEPSDLITPNDEVGNGTQLSRFHTPFDDEEDEEDDDW